MTVKHSIALAVKRLFLGKTNQPQQCTVGINDPQAEVSVWLRGIGAPRDVTFAHSIACAVPFTICIEAENGRAIKMRQSNWLWSSGSTMAKSDY